MDTKTKSEKLVFNAKIISGGRIAIPKTERLILDLDEGDYVTIEIKKLKKPQEAVATA